MIRIGKIVATHGLHGAVILNHIVGESKWLNTDDVLFLELNKGSYIPYFVVSVKPGSDEEYTLNLDEVDKIEAAKKLVGKKVYVNEDLLSGLVNESPLLWIGFNVVDKEKGSLGRIEDVLETGHQWLAKINYHGKEVLIPLIEEMILDVNIRNKFLRVDLPEGLLEL